MHWAMVEGWGIKWQRLRQNDARIVVSTGGRHPRSSCTFGAKDAKVIMGVRDGSER